MCMEWVGWGGCSCVGCDGCCICIVGGVGSRGWSWSPWDAPPIGFLATAGFAMVVWSS